MVSWSALGRSFGTNLFKNNLKSTNLIQNVNFSLAKTLNGDHGHKSMVLQPSRYNDISDYLTNFYTTFQLKYIYTTIKF